MRTCQLSRKECAPWTETDKFCYGCWLWIYMAHSTCSTKEKNPLLCLLMICGITEHLSIWYRYYLGAQKCFWQIIKEDILQITPPAELCRESYEMNCGCVILLFCWMGCLPWSECHRELELMIMIAAIAAIYLTLRHTVTSSTNYNFVCIHRNFQAVQPSSLKIQQTIVFLLCRSPFRTLRSLDTA